MRVLVSAYACEPGRGSEPGVGWNLARHLARYCEVWVLTRANNRPAIDAELARNPVPGLHFLYYDLPAWARWWKRGQRGVHLYYFLWQVGAYFVARRVHRAVGFDLVHHVTFVKYWMPSFLALLPVPFVWGPVGGGESVPLAFWPSFGPRGILYEALRTLARWLGEHDPFVRLTARRAVLALATTEETAVRLRRLGAKTVEVLSQAALPAKELEALSRLSPPPPRPVRFLSVGRLLHLKGFHLGLAAFARSGLRDAEYWLVGDGPERRRLERLARQLGIADRVRFWGQLPRSGVLELLGQCHALVHPSLHDSGGWVCLEAMAAGRPAICLDLGGPALQVTEETGFKVPARNAEQAIDDMTRAMLTLARDPQLGLQMGEAARYRVQEHFTWETRRSQLATLLSEVLKMPFVGRTSDWLSEGVPTSRSDIRETLL